MREARHNQSVWFPKRNQRASLLLYVHKNSWLFNVCYCVNTLKTWCGHLWQATPNTSEGQIWPRAPVCDFWLTHVPHRSGFSGRPRAAALPALLGGAFPKSPRRVLIRCPAGAKVLRRALHAPSRVDTVNNSSREKLTRPWTSPAGSPSGRPQKQWVVSTVNILDFGADTDFF